MKAIVLLSGGMDSTVVLYAAKRAGREIRAVAIDYGQRHRRELDAAKRIASLAGVDLRSLRTSIPWPPMAGDVLPGRNSVLLGIAAAHLATWSGGEGGEVWIGACGTDAAGFPDCRPDFLLASGKAFSLGLGCEVAVVAPLVVCTKAQTVAMARDIGAWDALALSWTCYRGEAVPCGTCNACRHRASGFAELGEVDPWHA